MFKKLKPKNYIAPLFALIGYLIFNILTLTKYPFIHSDESWLSGLSRTVLDKGTFSTSEPFFDLYPRAIHGLRVIFVSIQMSFIKLFGYTIFSVRLLSLIFATLTLVALYTFYKRRKFHTLHILVMLIAVAFNIQFIHTAHIARQDAIILFGMTFSYILVLTLKNRYRSIIVASSIGLMIGVHPNSFIIGCSIGLIVLYKVLSKEMSVKELFSFVITLALWAVLFTTISLYLNPNFISDYLAFGSQLGVTGNEISRLEGLYYYYYKLFNQIGGTYYLPTIKISFVVLIFSSFTSFVMFFVKSKFRNLSNNYIYPLLMILGINTGYFIIGRYNQTAIIFALVFGFICFFEILQSINNKYIITAILTVLLLLEVSNTYSIISDTNYQSYNQLDSAISEVIPRDANVLANLNLDYHFDLYKLYDYRNLDHLGENDLDFKAYISKNDISYIIVYDEMDYIYQNRPKWNILYGDLNYYLDMTDYLEKKCTLIKEIKMPTYAMRIAKYVDVFPWNARVYKVN